MRTDGPKGAHSAPLYCSLVQDKDLDEAIGHRAHPGAEKLVV